MLQSFNVEIISPDKSILKTKATEVSFPSYEGEVGILKDHISIITFLRPGIIKVVGEKEMEYFVEEGTVEFKDNNLLILSSTTKERSEIDKNLLESLIKEAEKKIGDTTITDKEKYKISHKLDTLKKIS